MNPRTIGVPFFYTVLFAALAPGAQVTQSIQIESGAGFHFLKASYLADIVAAIQTEATRVIPLVTLLLTSSESGAERISNAHIPVSSLFGTGDRPHVLPAPRIYGAGSTLTFEVINLTAATTYNLRLVLEGVRVPRGG